MGSSMFFLVCLMALFPMFLARKNPGAVDVQVLTQDEFCELLKNMSSLAEGINCIDLFEDEDTVNAIVDAISNKPPNNDPNHQGPPNNDPNQQGDNHQDSTTAKPFTPRRDENIELNHLLLGFITEHVKNLVEDAGHEPPAEVPVLRAGRDATDTEARHLSRRSDRQRHGKGGRGSEERRGGGWRGGWRGGIVVPPPPPFLPPNLNGVPVIVPINGGRKRALYSESLVRRQSQTQKALVNGTTKSAPRRFRQGDVARRLPFSVDKFGFKGNQKSDKKSQVTPEVVAGSAVRTTPAKPNVAGKQGKSQLRPNSNPRIFPQRG